MDRRRFNPSAEGLEGRALLSLFGGSGAKAAQANLQNIPTTFKQKELRIAHLPFFLEQEYPGRFLPEDTIKKLQADLTSVIASLHDPNLALRFADRIGLLTGAGMLDLVAAARLETGHLARLYGLAYAEGRVGSQRFMAPE